MSGHHHERLVCSCGAVIAQCRCMEPKTDRVVQRGCEKCKASAPPAAAYAEAPGRDYRKERDAAYTERNRLVAVLARLYPSHLADHRDEEGAHWDPEWRTVIFIQSPAGQLSWHLHDSDVPLFGGLPRGPNEWDGHTTEEKYARVARIGR